MVPPAVIKHHLAINGREHKEVVEEEIMDINLHGSYLLVMVVVVLL